MFKSYLKNYHEKMAFQINHFSKLSFLCVLNFKYNLIETHFPHNQNFWNSLYILKVASSSLVTHMINIAGWDWDQYLQHLVDIGIERRKWRDYMIQELYPLPGICINVDILDFKSICFHEF